MYVRFHRRSSITRWKPYSVVSGIVRSFRLVIAVLSLLALALDNGVKTAELSEIITHLAFYAGWGNAMAAVAVAKDIFHQRGIGVDQLPPVKDKPLPLAEEQLRRSLTRLDSKHY